MSEYSRIVMTVVNQTRGEVEAIDALKCFTVLVGYQVLEMLELNSNHPSFIITDDTECLVEDGMHPLLEEFFNLEVHPELGSLLHIQIEYIRNLERFGSQVVNSELFEYCIRELNQIRNNRDTSVPVELADLMNSFIIKKSVKSVFNPFARKGDILFRLPDSISIETENLHPWDQTFVLLRAMVLDKAVTSKKGNLLFEEHIESYHGPKYDAIVCCPPFNLRPHSLKGLGNQRSEDLVLNGFQYVANETGIGVFIVPLSFLNGRSTPLKDFVNRGWIDTIIQLPSRLLMNTAINTALVVIDKSKDPDTDITFLDASDLCFQENRQNILNLEKVFQALEGVNKSVYRKTPGSEVVSNEYNLTPSRYVYRNFELEARDDYVQISSVASRQTNRLAVGEDAYAIKISDLSRNGSFQELIINHERQREHQHPRRLIKVSPGDVVVTLRGSSFQPTLIGNEKQLGAMCPPLLVLKLNTDRIDPEYFLSALNTKEVTQQIAQYSAAVMGIRASDFLNIRIRLPSLDEQRSIVQSVKQGLLAAQAQELGVADELKQKQSEFFENLAYNRHTVNQDLAKVRSIVLKMSKMMEKRGSIKLDDLVSPMGNDTVKDRIDNLNEYLDQVSNQLQTLSAAPKFSEAIEINITDFISQWIENTSKPGNVDIPGLIENEIPQDIKISFGLKELNGVLDNLFENALKHGFLDENDSYRFSINLNLNKVQDSVLMTIGNDGEPLPVGIAEKFHLRGLKAGAHGNTGMGTAIISESVQNYGGKLKVLDPNDEFSVNIQIEFPIYDRGE